jgi:hypothetical protein
MYEIPMGWACSWDGETKNAVKLLVGKTFRNTSSSGRELDGSGSRT